MRIIGGAHKGRQIRVPGGLPVRPTTSFAMEGLFNILTNRIGFEGMDVLDLFSGTGQVSLEFASRGARSVTSVDIHAKCAAFLRDTATLLKLPVVTTKADVFAFLTRAVSKFDLIFADPPYDLPNIPQIHELVFSRDLLQPGGLLIIEHGPRTDLSSLEGFQQNRKYGNVHFSFFRSDQGQQEMSMH